MVSERTGPGSFVWLFVRVVAPGIERPPVPLLRAGWGIDEVAEFSGASPGVFAEGEPGFQDLLGVGAGAAAQFDRVADVAAGEGIRLHEGGEAADFLDDVVRGAARKIEDAHAPAAFRGKEVTHEVTRMQVMSGFMEENLKH